MLSTISHPSLFHQGHIRMTAPYTHNLTCFMRRNLITAAARAARWKQAKNSTKFDLPGFLQPMELDDQEYMKQFMAQPEHLQWFVGFAEGIGSWTVITKEGTGSQNNCFTMFQKCPQVLYKVKTLLGFGRVKKYGEGSRYIVADDKHTGKLIEIFSGNLKLERTKRDFEKYVNAYNSRVSPTDPSTYCDTVARPGPVSLYNGWLSGMIDAKGSFSASVELDGEIEVQFSLEEKDEKDLMQQIRKLLGTGRCSGTESGMYRYVLNNVRERERLVSYLDDFPLRSKKNIPYTKWKKLRYRILDGKERIEGRSYERLMRLVRTLNEWQ